MNFLEELFKKQVIPFLLTGSSLVIFILFHQLILFLNLVCQIFDNYKVVVVKKKKTGTVFGGAEAMKEENSSKSSTKKSPPPKRTH